MCAICWLSIVHAVLPIDLLRRSVMGGSYFKTNFIKGRVANANLASGWIAKSQVREVYLASLDLSSSFKQMTTMLPLATRSITLNNALLKTFPTDFAKFTALQELYESYSRCSYGGILTLCAVVHLATYRTTTSPPSTPALLLTRFQCCTCYPYRGVPSKHLLCYAVSR